MSASSDSPPVAMCPGPCKGGHAYDWYCHGWNPKRQKWCHLRAGQETDHLGYGNCKHHTGSTENGRKSAARKRALGEFGEMVAARMDAADFEGVPNAEAMLRILREDAVVCDVLFECVTSLPAETRWDWELVEGPNGGKQRWVRIAEAGVIGPDHQGDLRPHIWLTLYGEWTDKHARHLKMASDMNLDEQSLALAQDQLRIMAGVLEGTMQATVDLLRTSGADLALIDVVRVQLPALVRTQLELVEGTGR